MIEESISDFKNMYEEYNTVFDKVEYIILNLDCDEDIHKIQVFKSELLKFDAKLRLGMGIFNIDLDYNFVREKYGQLKECHLMYYKLIDIWFAYETFFKIFELTFNIKLHNKKITWLIDEKYTHYSNNSYIKKALLSANEELKSVFHNRKKKQIFKDYLFYCLNNSKGKSRDCLNKIYESIEENEVLPFFQSADVLTMTYAMRNNFVHNGEITIYPPNFSYVLKNELLKILYKYIVVVTICSVKITTEHNNARLETVLQ